MFIIVRWNLIEMISWKKNPIVILRISEFELCEVRVFCFLMIFVAFVQVNRFLLCRTSQSVADTRFLWAIEKSVDIKIERLRTSVAFFLALNTSHNQLSSVQQTTRMQHSVIIVGDQHKTRIRWRIFGRTECDKRIHWRHLKTDTRASQSVIRSVICNYTPTTADKMAPQ